MSEKLFQAIRKVQTEIKDHAKEFIQNEEQTIITLINPILREIGWQTTNPREVKRQFSVEGGRVDIALLRNEEPVVFVEAKALNTKLDSNLKQVSDYCSHRSVPTALLTDGAEWRVYRPLMIALPFDQRQILQIRLGENETDAREAAQHLSQLAPKELEHLEARSWSIFLDNYWQVKGSKDAELLKKMAAPLRQSFATHLRKRRVEVPLDAVRDFLSAKLEAKPARQSIHQPRPSKPEGKQKKDSATTSERAIILAGERIKVKSMSDAYLQAANWLIQRGHLHRSECPIRTSKSATTRYAIHTEPKHPAGHGFHSPKRLSNGLFLEVHGSRSQNKLNIQNLLQRYGYPTNTLQLSGFGD